MTQKPKRLRILYHALVEIELPDGHAIHTREICEHLTSLGHEVTLVCPKPRGPLPFKPNYEIVGVPFYGFTWPRLIVHYLLSFFTLLRVVQRVRPDYIHDKNTVANPFPELIAHATGTPFSLEINGYCLDFLEPEDGLRRRLFAFLERFKFHSAQKLISTSPDFVADASRHYDLEPNRFGTIDNGVGSHFFERFERSRVRTDLGIDDSSFVIAHVGRFLPWQDLGTICRAIADLRQCGIDARGLFIGEGGIKGEVEALCRDLEIENSVVFPGFVPNEEVPRYLAASDCAAVLRIGRVAGSIASAMKLKEYLAAGVPVITNEIPGDDAGLSPYLHSIPLEDVAAFGAACRAIRSDRAHASEVAEAAAQAVRERFSWKSTALQFAEILAV